MQKTAKLFVMMLAAHFCSSAQSNLKLWYNKPAASWNEALPIGNGRLGAMVFGNVHNAPDTLSSSYVGYSQATMIVDLNEETMFVRLRSESVLLNEIVIRDTPIVRSIEEFERASVYIEIITDPDFRDNIKSKYKLSEDRLYELRCIQSDTR